MIQTKRFFSVVFAVLIQAFFMQSVNASEIQITQCNVPYYIPECKINVRVVYRPPSNYAIIFQIKSDSLCRSADYYNRSSGAFKYSSEFYNENLVFTNATVLSNTLAKVNHQTGMPANALISFGKKVAPVDRGTKSPPKASPASLPKVGRLPPSDASEGDPSLAQ
jgi:hypothetical protein